MIVLCALLCGLLFTRFKQPAVLGYVLAGVVLGPNVLSDGQSHDMIRALAELGVFMLMFLIGMELNLRSFKDVWLQTIGVVTLQFAGSLGAMFLASLVFKWPFALTFLFSCIVALSSTAVSIKMLESTGELRTNVGRLTVGILIAQDLAFVPMIITIQFLGGGDVSVSMLMWKVILAVGIIATLIGYISRKERISLPVIHKTSQTTELVPLLALTFCFGLAAIAGFLGLSAAYGAFLAGLVLGNTADRHAVINVTRPIQSTLLMIFFLSVGLLVDISYIWDNVFIVLWLLVLIALGKTILNATILHLFKQPWSMSFLCSLMLAQIGEFSFVLADTAMEAGVLSVEENKLVISLTVLSLVFSPFWAKAANKLQGMDALNLKTFRDGLNTIYGVGQPTARHVSKVLTQITIQGNRVVKAIKHKIRRKP
jgi:CPA2 family monovalent cation:H+ antiporter-2